MAIRNIVKEGDPVLKKVSRPVEKFDDRLHVLLDDMYETMKKDGVGLAAVQVGVLRRVVVIDIGEGRIELINPEIIAQEGEQQDVEGCLSCPGKYGVTSRPMQVTVKAQDRNGEYFTITGRELLARAFCHEIDHLDGKLFYSHVLYMLDDEK
ncbi:peptide deformylase [Solibaculum mannosilyticum]|uniref:Peptide deformylase n=1 Tax=Solibaculum mannosilyticum TaxID=2780922 RepID=A0A7I8D005_9FIRM|nr:peptide deformylase [Solibaculum mannosilyticum]MCO7136461.1 peptide deformylase [[Clostridium] leptum]BCI60088.1 peptide deformylase [Solibaculum mannosilyticum]CZT57254.1 Peptide deformylase 1 [Eubacteriaceae bacterium CHKCI005]